MKNDLVRLTKEDSSQTRDELSEMQCRLNDLRDEENYLIQQEKSRNEYRQK